jgi:DNA-binding response OmpR family regulator
VALVHWPREADRRTRLLAGRVPCLLLVAPDADPPVVEDWEDWICLPADERDVSVRLHGLARRVCQPQFVDDDVLRNSYGTVVLPPAERTIARALLESRGTLVSRAQLTAQVWPDQPPSARALDDLVYRLRRHLRPLHLDVFTARGRGFLIGVLIEHTARRIPPIGERR